jgi:hypothetical protein
MEHLHLVVVDLQLRWHLPRKLQQVGLVEEFLDLYQLLLE